MTRKLATIRKIAKIEPIPGKDRVEMAYIDGWSAMISKSDHFHPGDLIIFCEEDSVFPHEDRWEFLKKYNYRIKIQRFKSDNGYIYSQGLVLPITILNKDNIKIGDDVTNQLHITQYEPEMDIERDIDEKNRFMMRFKWFRKFIKRKTNTKGFPKEVSKTDEERIQNYITTGFDTYIDDNNVVRICNDDEYVVTEKIDGQSGTFFMKKKKILGIFNKYEYKVCSRNMVNKNPSSSYNIVSKKYDIENVLKLIIKKKNLTWVCIQGECIGPNIQSNKYHANDFQLYVFNLIDNKHGRLDSYTMRNIVESYGLNSVPIIDCMSLKNKSVEDILELSNGESCLWACNNTPREGLVFRDLYGRKSFKAVSPEFLFKYNK